MKFLKRFQELDKKFSEKLDLTKKYPGYFTKVVFRTAAVIGALLILFTLHSNGWQWSGQYVYCDGGAPCMNPYYSPVCSSVEFCGIQVLPAGFQMGNKPTWMTSNISTILLGLLVVSFVVNHIVYKVRRRG